jgi:long-subunit fatty acid transport protein
MSFVIPRGRYAIALYRQQLLKFEDSFETEGVFQSQGARELALQATREFNIVNYGVSTAVRFNNVFSLGVGLSLHRLTLESRFNRYTFSGPFSSASYASDLERARSLQNGGDTNAALNVGVLWSVHPQVRLGMVFRQGPDFDVTFVEGPLDEFVERQGSLNVPDRYSVGAAIRLTGELTVAAEVTHVRYSSLQTFVDMQSALSGRSSQFSVHDGTEIHGGVEYVFAGASLQPAIRFGVWHDPDHSIEYEPTAARDRADERYSAYLANRGAELHVTGGMGLALNRRLELNVAADVSPRNRTMSASTVVRF